VAEGITLAAVDIEGIILHYHWSLISDLGDAALTLPLAIAMAVWFYTARARLGLSWLLCLAAGALLVGLTKILYAGCGIQIRAIDFRVISGHTMLASAVWTTVGASLGRAISRRGGWRGALATAFGLALAAAIGLARVEDGAHSSTEVIVGWVLGVAVAATFLRVLQRAAQLPRRPFVAGCFFLLVSALAYGHHAPFQAMIEEYSPWLCRG
jgi:membrane-associated phospholipid phosphatase